MKKNRLNLMSAGLCGAGLFTGILTANAQGTVTFVGVNPVEVVNVQSSGVITFPVTGAYAGIYNQVIDGQPTPSFCIDVFRDAILNQPYMDYSYVNLASAPLSPAGPMGSGAATDIEKLWAAYFPAATLSGQDAAALQVAIWEDVALNVGTYTLTFSGNNPVTIEAASMLANLPNLTVQADLVGLVSPTGQNYVVPAPAPEPTTLALASLGGLGVLLLRRRN
jgi:hypothetical protein